MSAPIIKWKSVLIGIVSILSVFSWVLFSDDAYLIKDPVPTVTEDKVVYLEEVQKMGMDLGNDEYLFVPRSIAVDKSNVFVYDSSQKKVFRFSSDLKLIGSFGREGQGPGEFSNGKWVELSIGQDGNLYANDIHGFKIMGYTRNGKHLKTFKYGPRSYFFKPVCDKQGNILYVSKKKDLIEVKTDQDIVLAECKYQKLYKSFLFEMPSKEYRDLEYSSLFLPFTTWNLTKDSKLLILFLNSSVISVFNGSEYIKTLKIWPQNALPDYKKTYREMKKKELPGFNSIGTFGPMFGGLTIDQDDPNIFYLNCGYYSTEDALTVLYEFNLEGKLLNVIQIPISSANEDSYRKPVRVQAKANNAFYAIRGGEEVVLYKEK